jgi:hypothetical protein
MNYEGKYKYLALGSADGYKVRACVFEKMAKTMTLFVMLLLFLSGLHYSNAEQQKQPFDVRKHLSTVSRFLSFFWIISLEMLWNILDFFVA